MYRQKTKRQTQGTGYNKNIFCYREDTEEIRKGDWEANTIPENLRERHVELTGPGNDPKNK